jgi:hypothetical protein
MKPQENRSKHQKNKSGRRLSIGLLIAVLLTALAYGFQGPSKKSGKSSPFDGQRAFHHLKTIVDFGPRPAGSDALAKTRAYIIRELSKVALKAQLDEFEAVTPRGPRRMVNIRAVRAGASSASTISLAGHYDTKLFDFRFVGANDGGSSAAWLLEMARATRDLKLQNSVEFIFFDGEEAVGTPKTVAERTDWTPEDSLYGSRYDVDRRKKAGTLAQLKALILVDMIGDKELNIPKEPTSTAWLTSIIWDTAHSLGFRREFLNVERRVQDDHLPFLQAGIPAMDIIDLDYGPDNSHWHNATVTLDKTSAQSLKVVGDVVYFSLSEIDSRVSQPN